MSSYGEQYESARRTNQAVRDLETSARARVREILVDAGLGRADPAATRIALREVVLHAYQSSSSLGLAHIAAQVGLPRWLPDWAGSDSEVNVAGAAYLSGLLRDVERAMDEFYSDTATDTDRDKILTRVSHSAGVSAARGHTDALVLSARELSIEHGFVLRKVWRANFVDHVPCELCAALDGTSVPVGAEFPAGNRLRVYGDLLGPPRHPHCMCWLVILVDGLDTWGDSVDPAQARSEPTAEMSTDDVKAMSPGFRNRILRWLRTFVRNLRSTP